MIRALVAELAYAQRLGRCPERVAGSNPAEGTSKEKSNFVGSPRSAWRPNRREF